MPKFLILSTAIAAVLLSGASLLSGAGSPAMAQGTTPSDRMEPPAEAVKSPEAEAAIEEAKPDEAAIRTALQVKGYSDIRNLRKEGDHYLAEADQFGETVEVRVDAKTRLVVAPTRLSEAQIRNKLEQEGYSEIRGLGRADTTDAFNAKAEKDGRTVSLRIDPLTGNVMLEKSVGE